jgi:hypothetical protein
MYNKKNFFKKIKLLSDKYHKMSLLFYELEQSLKYQEKHNNLSLKELKDKVKEFDLDKVEEISRLPKKKESDLNERRN